MKNENETLIKTAADIRIDKSVWFWFLNITSPSGFAPPSHLHSLPTTPAPLPIERSPQICNYCTSLLFIFFHYIYRARNKFLNIKNANVE